MKLHDAIEQYVEWRQAHGAKFITTRNLLRRFLRYANGDASCNNVTENQIMAFLGVRRPTTRHRENKAYALAGFWRYAVSRGYVSWSLLPEYEQREASRPPPHIYTREQLRRLFDPIHITGSLRGAKQLDATTFRTLLFLLYGAGLRFSEATDLTFADVDISQALLTIRHTKFHKNRLVPVGPQLATLLGKYMSERHDKPVSNAADFFLKNRDGTRLASSTVQSAFEKLRSIAEVYGEEGGRKNPRMHDLRHSFAVHSLTAWYQQGADVQRLLPVLSTYLGHSDLDGTKVYLSMTPNLLRQASLRFEDFANGGQHGAF